jgi:hypothetical protein
MSLLLLKPCRYRVRIVDFEIKPSKHSKKMWTAITIFWRLHRVHVVKLEKNVMEHSGMLWCVRYRVDHRCIVCMKIKYTRGDQEIRPEWSDIYINLGRPTCDQSRKL